MSRTMFRMQFPAAVFVALHLAALPQASAQSKVTVDTAAKAQAYRQGQPVPAADGMIVCEAEEFRVEKPGGWQAQNWGSNYYAATFANSFLSRKAYLGAPEQCERSVATLEVAVPAAGRYLALVRYEAAYRFETQFRVQVEQNGALKLDRLYGARDNLKVWAFSEKLKKEVAWPWGAGENVVWEGHDAAVDLEPGRAIVRLIADKQTGNAAQRNVDLVLLTKDAEDVQNRIQKDAYLPLDGLLTQADDVYVKLHNQADGAALKLTLPPCTEHSPYWVHARRWKAKEIPAEAGQSTDWIEVGSLLDTLNDGQWNITAAPVTAGAALHYKLEFGVRSAQGAIEPLATFESRKPALSLAYYGDTRYSRRLHGTDTVLYELLDYLKKQPVTGKLPEQTLIYASTFDKRPDDPQYNAAVDEFSKMFALVPRTVEEAAKLPQPSAYIDIRTHAGGEELYKKWQAQGIAGKIAVVSLGDEIGLAGPPADGHAAFRTWLQSRGVKPADVDPAAGDDWNKVQYNAAPDLAKTNPRLFYFTQLYGHQFGIQKQKELTQSIQKYLPNALIGANYSPHHGYHYLGHTHMWVNMFREGGMTLPWSEDYIWQVPVGSQQVNFISLDLFRAGIRGKPQSKIQFYVMPHWGNTPASWRRQFYGDLQHGMKIVDLFEFRPVQAAYTENHADQPEMYAQIRSAFHELGMMEDIVQAGQVRPGVAALWFSETSDIWDDGRAPFSAGKRTLYIAVKHQQLALDFVVDQDAIDGALNQYKILYLADQHVSRAASQGIADWVKKGGLLFATAGAGMFDEFNAPNTILRDLLGVDQTSIEDADKGALVFEKQDLQFLSPVDAVTASLAPMRKEAQMPVISVRSRIQLKGAQVKGTFADGSPAITFYQKPGFSGAAYYTAFLPGLTYFKPAIPLRPWDRGSSEKSMTHFLPTEFDGMVSELLSLPIDEVQRPVLCSEPLVETSVIESKAGTLIPLVNWSRGPVEKLKVTLKLNVPFQKVTLASGKPVTVAKVGNQQVFTLDLDVADALILR